MPLCIDKKNERKENVHRVWHPTKKNSTVVLHAPQRKQYWNSWKYWRCKVTRKLERKKIGSHASCDVQNFFSSSIRNCKCVYYIFDSTNMIYFCESASLAMLIPLREWDIFHVMLINSSMSQLPHLHTHIYRCILCITITLLKLEPIFSSKFQFLHNVHVTHILWGKSILFYRSAYTLNSTRMRALPRANECASVRIFF